MNPDPLVTVIVAVWHRQRDKHELLRGHMDNLARQTVPVAPIYVFDNGDDPPGWLRGQKISASTPLTLYEAWNLALAATRTPLVANLNLDDRFAVDALGGLTAVLQEDPDAVLVGGDWIVCHSQEETDAVGVVRAVDGVARIGAWPPGPERGRRLGTGDDAKHVSMGPACLWRMDAHLTLPRYPYRFADGTPIRVIGDSIWWQLLGTRLGKRLVRVPYVIGHYRTWPESQAEFRYSAADERAKSDVSLL
jgi:hypothetical protein